MVRKDIRHTTKVLVAMDARLDEYLENPTTLTSRELLAWLEVEKGQPVHYNGRHVGAIYYHSSLGKIYVTMRNKNEHVYKKWKSIGISRDIIIKLMSLGVKKIVIVFKDTSEVWITTPQKFLEEGRALWFYDEKDSQLHLPISSMIRII